MSDWLESRFLSHLLGVSAFAAPSAVYLGLSTTAGGFGETGSGTESSLARQAISFNAASNSSISSSATIYSPRLTGSPETLHGWGIFDAQTGGNLLYYDSFPSSISLIVGDSAAIPAGGISIATSGVLEPYAFKAWSDHCLRNTSWTMPSALYLALDRTGSTLGKAVNSFSTLGGGSFDEPRWHDHSSGTVTYGNSAVHDGNGNPILTLSEASANGIPAAGLINGSAETYGGYQRCRLVYNAASGNSATLNHSVTRDDGLWDNSSARSNNWDSTNNRKENSGATELRTWTDRVEFPQVAASYQRVGGYTNLTGGVPYQALYGWRLIETRPGYQTQWFGDGFGTHEYFDWWAYRGPASAAHYSICTGWGIFDAEEPTTGNLLMRGSFDSDIDAYENRDVVRIPASSYTVTAD